MAAHCLSVGVACFSLILLAAVTIRLFMIDSQYSFSEQMKAFLRLSSFSITVVGVMRSGLDALQILQEGCSPELQPDVLVIRTMVPDSAVIQFVRYSQQHLNSLKIIVLADLNDKQFLLQLLRLNVQGCLSCQISMSDLCQTIQVVCQGYYRVDSAIIHYLFSEIFSNNDRLEVSAPNGNDMDINCTQEDCMQTQNGISQLSPREIEVLRLIAAGSRNQEIAKALFIAEKTVKNHITKIFKKLDIQNRTQAAIIGRQRFNQEI